MNKKNIALLLVAAISITGVFAYESPSVILTANKSEVDYSFKVQKLDKSETVFKDLSAGDSEDVTLDATGGETLSYAVATIDNGNMHDDITFTTVIRTGEFIDAEDESIGSGWYPVIEDRSASVNDSVSEEHPETIKFSSVNVGDYNDSSSGVYVSTFVRGRHLSGAELARFKLRYKADDELVAGSYKSTTTVDITTD